MRKQISKYLYRIVVTLVMGVFFATQVLTSAVYAQIPITSNSKTLKDLPPAGSQVGLSQKFFPANLRGLKTYPDNPLQFDFIVDTGDDNLTGPVFEEESKKLIKYFLAALTVPEDELWVNLSPYEKDRIIPEGLSVTELGVDMLAQDYLLKQLTASLSYPEENLGAEFWQRVRAKAKEVYGTDNIPINTFNKVWIVPDKAGVYEHNDSVFVIERHLKVMLENDYLALEKNLGRKGMGLAEQSEAVANQVNNISGKIVKEIILPAIEQEVNEGKNFAQLRQIYNAMILATWYKKRLKASLLGQVYVNKNKIKGVDVDDHAAKEKLYAQYLEAFKKGVYNYIKEDHDAISPKAIPRKYFSGGLGAGVVTTEKLQIFRGAPARLPKSVSSAVMLPESRQGKDHKVTIQLIENATNARQGSPIIWPSLQLAGTVDRKGIFSPEEAARAGFLPEDDYNDLVSSPIFVSGGKFVKSALILGTGLVTAHYSYLNEIEIVPRIAGILLAGGGLLGVLSAIKDNVEIWSSRLSYERGIIEEYRSLAHYNPDVSQKLRDRLPAARMETREEDLALLRDAVAFKRQGYDFAVHIQPGEWAEVERSETRWEDDPDTYSLEGGQPQKLVTHTWTEEAWIEERIVIVQGESLFDRSSSPIQGGGRLTQADSENVGGINLSAELLNLQIKRDENGVPLSLAQQTIQNMKIDGFLPVIINIEPVSIPLLFGISSDRNKKDGVFP
ncbi:MAG: hypothetical protein WC450_03865 [Candidatus Omnitrophota bacterium]